MNHQVSVSGVSIAQAPESSMADRPLSYAGHRLIIGECRDETRSHR
jgi:hypothetical protein